MSLSEAIKSMRIKALMSQEELAENLHVSVGTINRWENGKTTPNISAMKKLKSYCEKNEISCQIIEEKWLAERLEAKR